jgi:DNA polymerase-1
MPTRPRQSLYIIDGHAQIYRAYHAIRSLSSPVTGEPTNATFGFVGMLLKLFRDCRPDYVVVTIDVGGDQGTFRSQLDPEYKANRSQMPDDMPPQIQRIVDLCRLWGIPVIGVPGFEADDIIATLCTRLAGRDDLDIKIVSRDKDLEQLLGDRVTMYDIHKDQTIDVATLQQEKNITPSQVIDVLALMGDSVDNIPGAHGVGPKTAAKLISQYGSLDNLLAHTAELTGKTRQAIEQIAPRLPLNRQLVSLRHDVPVDLPLEQAAAPAPPPVDQLRPVFKQLGFHRHLTDLESLAGHAPTSSDDAAGAADAPPQPRASPPSDTSAIGGLFDGLEGDTPPPQIPHYAKARPEQYQSILNRRQLDDLVAELQAAVDAGLPISFDTETDQLDPMRCNLCGVSLAWKPESGVYIPVRCAEAPDTHLDETSVIDALRPILTDPRARLVGQNIKYDLLVLRRAGLEIDDIGRRGFDTLVASYVVDATRSSHKLDNLSLAFLNHEMIPITALIGSGKRQRSMADLSYVPVTTYAAEDADIALRLMPIFESRMKPMGLTELFRELEMPMVRVLAELEFNGILVDPDELDRQKRAVDQRIGQVHEQILHAAGAEFNPDSPPQLAEVLFKKLKCAVVKRGKTGPSTDSEVLERIANEQPPPGSVVAELILEYRMLTKLRSTYLESLKEAINPRTGRIHASFNQTVAATGRLSSSDPNLQNIPIRTELGRQIRKAFIAPPGQVLLSADYSQIELRLLAHLSQDPGLMEAFEQDQDIHTAVAGQIFSVPPDQVTPEQRGTAKMVNFGIVYGITPFGLARRLPPQAAGSSVDQARQIIGDYRRRYPKIDAFLDRCVEMAETRGYVQTIRGRRRNIPEVKSNNPNLVALGKRMAINTVVQGSAADLIKLSMIRVHERIGREKLPMKMLLQIHDELVFECPADQAEAMSRIVQGEMTGAMSLSVPLKVDVSWGVNWFEG